jgi:hypothetical protein
MSDDDDLVLVFIPSLAALLTRAEQLKGKPLTKREVEAIRDQANVVATPRDVAEDLAKTRGYDDVDPENVWNEWRKLSR